jgi:hypothetical protein
MAKKTTQRDIEMILISVASTARVIATRQAEAVAALAKNEGRDRLRQMRKLRTKSHQNTEDLDRLQTDLEARTRAIRFWLTRSRQMMQVLHTCHKQLVRLYELQ